MSRNAKILLILIVIIATIIYGLRYFQPQLFDTNRLITAHLYSCPSLLDMKTQTATLKPGDLINWKDNKGLSWQIYVPNSIVSPIKVISFSHANWRSNHTLLCSFTSQGSNYAILAYGNFNTAKPTQQPWTKTQDNESMCRGDPQSCKFNILKISN